MLGVGDHPCWLAEADKRLFHISWWAYAGYHPWAPDAQQDDLEAASTAASTVATSAAAPALVAMPETLTSATPPASLSDGAAISHDQSMLRWVAASKGGESQRRVAGMGQDRALPTTAVQGLPATAPRATPDVPRATEGGHSQVIPPSAGRGSEGGVSTSEPASVTAKLDMASAADLNKPKPMNKQSKPVAQVFDQSKWMSLQPRHGCFFPKEVLPAA